MDEKETQPRVMARVSRCILYTIYNPAGEAQKFIGARCRTSIGRLLEKALDTILGINGDHAFAVGYYAGDGARDTAGI